jgi:hypothetical protein
MPTACCAVPAECLHSAGRALHSVCTVLRRAGKASALCYTVLHSAAQCWQSVRALNYAELRKNADNANNPNAFRINVN